MSGGGVRVGHNDRQYCVKRSRKSAGGRVRGNTAHTTHKMASGPDRLVQSQTGLMRDGNMAHTGLGTWMLDR